jgi:integrase/recombinase XerD
MDFEDYLRPFLSDQTVKIYCYHVDHFLRLNKRAVAMSYNQLIDFFLIRPANRQSTAKLAAIKHYYDFLIFTGVRSDHPCKHIHIRHRHKDVQFQDLFSPFELEQLLERENRYSLLQRRNKVIISLLIYQALTSTEVCDIKCEHLDLSGGTLYIRGSRRNNARRLELKAKQIVLIHEYLTMDRPKLDTTNSNMFLLTSRGKTETAAGLLSMIEPLKVLYPDRKLNLSTIRQSVISNLLNIQKEPLEEVQLFAGHKWPSSTEVYFRGDLKDRIEKINLWHPLNNR